RVGDRTTSPAPVGTAIPRASLEEIAVTWPDRKVVTKADNAAKQKASIGPEISTNATKKTQSSKKRSEAGSSGQSARDGVEQEMELSRLTMVALMMMISVITQSFLRRISRASMMPAKVSI
ncbi:hypothetical protein Tco_0322760, partial [Tanacetum coccineum]